MSDLNLSKEIKVRLLPLQADALDAAAMESHVKPSALARTAIHELLLRDNQYYRTNYAKLRNADEQGFFSFRCDSKLADSIRQAAMISGVTANEYAQVVLQNAVDHHVLVAETFEDQRQRFALMDTPGPFLRKKLTAVFGSPVFTFADNDAQMKSHIKGNEKIRKRAT